MADTVRDQPQQRRNQTDDNLSRETAPSTSSESERERVRSSNDRDQAMERDGISSRHNRGHDEAVNGQTGPTDPDSAESQNDRDDTVTE